VPECGELREHDATTADRRERMRNVEPESARMLMVVKGRAGEDG